MKLQHASRSHHHNRPKKKTRNQANTVTFGTYNVKNLFDNKDQDPKLGTVAKPEKELRFLAEQLRKGNADVVALQEVENLPVLKKFLKDYMPGEYSEVVLVEGNDRRGIDVAVISKYPIKTVVTHKDNEFPTAKGDEMMTFNRDLLRVDVEVKGSEWSVYTTHLKSKLGGPVSDNERVGEAREIRRILEEEMKPFPQRNFVVMGDLNDTPESDTIQTLLNGDEPLINNLEHADENNNKTFPAKRPKEQIDYVLFPEHLEDNLVSTGTVGGQNAKLASDHMMVTATFRLN